MRDFDRVWVKRNKNNASYKVKYAMTFTERRNLMRDCGDAALCLFEYYLRVAAMNDVIFSDEGAAEYFDWDKQKAQRVRLKLEKAGWVGFSWSKSRFNTSDEQMIYLGQDEVAAANLKESEEE